MRRRSFKHRLTSGLVTTSLKPPIALLRFIRHCTPRTLRRAIAAAIDQRLTGLAAEIAYNAMLSLFPSMLAILTAIGLFEPLKRTFQKLALHMGTLAPNEALGIINGVADSLSSTRDGNLFSFSFLFALWASSAALSAAMIALDQIHQVPLPQRRTFWQSRIVALLLTIGALILLLLAIAFTFLAELALDLIATHSKSALGQQLLTFALRLPLPVALGIMSLLFAFLYRFGASVRRPGQPIFPGAFAAALLWAIASHLLRFFIFHFGGYNQVYGAVSAVLILLLWLYMSSLVLLLGEQLNVTVGDAMRENRQRRTPQPPQ